MFCVKDHDVFAIPTLIINLLLDHIVLLVQPTRFYTKHSCLQFIDPFHKRCYNFRLHAVWLRLNINL